MNALRPFARPVVLLWLCAFALFLAAPMEAFAKREMTIGDGRLEGDPTDTVESGGSDGGVDLPFGSEWLSERTPSYGENVVLFPIVLIVPGQIYYLPFYTQFLVPFEFRGGEL